MNAIIIILIAVLGLVVVKALMHSSWGSFTVLMTIPIAMLVGIYLYYIRPNGVIEASLVGIALFLLAVYGGKIVHYDENLSLIFDRSGKFLAISIIYIGSTLSSLNSVGPCSIPWSYAKYITLPFLDNFFTIFFNFL